MTEDARDTAGPQTLGQLLAALTRRFEAAGVPSPRLDAQLLTRHVLGWSGTQLLTRANEGVPLESAARLEALARRREAREPLQHLLGEVEWGDVRLRVSPAALVPRPETELLLEFALREIQDLSAPRVLDVGTGTGALALGVKQARPDAEVWATDLSADALALARENAALLNLAVHFAQGDLHAGVRGPFDLIVSNPPYLPGADEAALLPEVRFDPPLALYGGSDGLGVARRLVTAARALLRGDGLLALELDPRNVNVLAGELPGRTWASRVRPDLTGRDRFLLARKQA